MSGRAAARLEEMGFEVYAYEAGKSDWFAAGLERAGEYANVPRIGDYAEEAPTCSPDDRIAAVRARAEKASWDVCVVVNSDGIVLGLLRSAIWDADPERKAIEVAHPGPKTYRADYTLDDPVEYMESNRLDSVLVTTPEGRLVGIARLEGPRRYMEEFRRQMEGAHRRE